MRLNWKGWGQKHYYDTPRVLRLHWNHNSGNYSVYCLQSLRPNGAMVLLLFRVYDFAWQENL